jgi:hypothetical protein
MTDKRHGKVLCCFIGREGWREIEKQFEKWNFQALSTSLSVGILSVASVYLLLILLMTYNVEVSISMSQLRDDILLLPYNIKNAAGPSMKS